MGKTSMKNQSEHLSESFLNQEHRYGTPHSILFSVDLGYLGEGSVRKEGPGYLTGSIQNLF